MRILLHPGFHKTGTSSLQRGAVARQQDLSAHLHLMLTPDVIGAARAARRFSARPQTENLRRFAEEFSAALPEPQSLTGRALLISCEDLCGYIPGNHGIEAYDAAPSLMNTATAVLHARYGEAARIIIWFTTRDGDAWQRSVYYQNLRAMRLTRDFDGYRETLTRAAQLDTITSAVAARLGPRATVHATAIEACGKAPLGPLGEALRLLEIRADHIAPVHAQNVQPDGAAEALLALNRSDLDDQALAGAKRDLLHRLRAAARASRDEA